MKKNISLLMIFFTVSFSRFAPSRAMPCFEDEIETNNTSCFALSLSHSLSEVVHCMACCGAHYQPWGLGTLPELFNSRRGTYIGNSQWGGGEPYRAILGGGETYHKAPPPKPVLEASESGICLVSARFL